MRNYQTAFYKVKHEQKALALSEYPCLVGYLQGSLEGGYGYPYPCILYHFVMFLFSLQMGRGVTQSFLYGPIQVDL